MEATQVMPRRWTTHCRAYDGDRGPLPRGGATLVIEKHEDGGFLVAVTLCSREDNFCRRAGIAIARTRLDSWREGKTVHNVVQVGEAESRGEPMRAGYLAFLLVIGRPSKHRGNGGAAWYSDHVLRPFRERTERTA